MVRLVRVYARKVRSDARWSRATLPEFSRVSMSRHRFDSSRHHGSLPSSLRGSGPLTSRAVAASSTSCCSSVQSGVELPLPLRGRRFRPRMDISRDMLWWCRSRGWAREGAGDGGRGGETEVGRLVRTVGDSNAAIFGGIRLAVSMVMRCEVCARRGGLRKSLSCPALPRAEELGCLNGRNSDTLGLRCSTSCDSTLSLSV